ncbi:ankyrin repeat and IBR domain-containing protein 1-like [Paramacrobiotus metropolitanus]|uniref:ankyrin repeat and IBR domain-containing protein 1-like n=1 Tax=Paramacrobiotus metropolitanus TaxID=2943436 RepID=UPI002446277E|nr:ankyrin repeat and IBR domain-containing protein 1-like [Paramacrobiotus metropolitanus]
MYVVCHHVKVNRIPGPFKMGNHKSKLRRHLAHGDEAGALELLKNRDDLRKQLDIEIVYIKNEGNTPFQLACIHGMETLIRTFLTDYSVDITKRNSAQETAVHCVCRLPFSIYLKDLPQYHGDRKHKCLKLILEYKDTENAPLLLKEVYMMLDMHGNTPLHLAAAHGFLEICEEIVEKALEPLFVRNGSGKTPVDLACDFGHERVAEYLESKTVFHASSNHGKEFDDESEDWTIGHTESFDGLRIQDLQRKKDQLVVETSDMLHVPLFTAEALLRNFAWSRQALLDSWFENPAQCCKNAGVKLPESFAKRRKHGCYKPEDLELGSPKRTLQRKADSMCPICAEDMPCEEEPVYLACEHDFCRNCWQQYLTIKIHNGNIYPIVCPDSSCSVLVPCDVVEGLVSREVARKYLQFDIEAFVESNPNMKWCPFAGCGRAVCRPELPAPLSLDIPHMKPPLATSHAVDCGNGHYFCWECSGEAHEPSSCDKWTEWHQRIIDVRPEEIRGTHEALEEAANNLWLVTNSKPCPSCKSPIQKTDGCNHMKCCKCKHDFCWICGDAWKKHSTATGGYFRCTRADAVHKAQDEAGKLISAAEEKNRRINELNRFVHFYGKYKAHGAALKNAQPFIDNVDMKICRLSTYMNVSAEQFSYLREAAHELLKARKVLKGSYVYAYYLEDHRILFEYMQTELENATELMDSMFSTRFLRHCRDDMVNATRLIRRRRQEFVVAVNKGLIIPETPPSVRKKRKRRIPGLFGMDFDDVVLQEDMGAAIAVSLADLDPQNPWVVDKRGRHANLAALYDWPEFDDSDEDVGMLLSSSGISLNPCSRPGCSRPCAKNPRTGIYHRHCTLRCKRLHEDDAKESVEDDQPTTSGSRASHKLDMIIAMELSRLQMQRDLENRTSSFSSESSIGTASRRHSAFAAEVPGVREAEEYDLNLAIQLSLQDLQERKQSESEDLPVSPGWENHNSESVSSLESADFAHITANELFLDHLQKMTDTNILKNTEPDEPGTSK